MTAKPHDWPEWSVCTLADLGDPGARGFYVGEEDWPFRGFVVRRGADVFAYANICPHRRHPLDFLPDVFLVEDGKLIRCASHGALFDPESGECLAGPCHGERLMKLPIRIDDAGIIVVMAPDSLRKIGQIGGDGLNVTPGADSDTN